MAPMCVQESILRLLFRVVSDNSNRNVNANANTNTNTNANANANPDSDPTANPNGNAEVFCVLNAEAFLCFVFYCCCCFGIVETLLLRVFVFAFA